MWNSTVSSGTCVDSGILGMSNTEKEGEAAWELYINQVMNQLIEQTMFSFEVFSNLLIFDQHTDYSTSAAQVDWQLPGTMVISCASLVLPLLLASRNFNNNPHVTIQFRGCRDTEAAHFVWLCFILLCFVDISFFTNVVTPCHVSPMVPFFQHLFALCLCVTLW